MTNSSIHDFCSQFDSNSVLLFDLDGTLVQTDAANNSAYLFAVKEILGIELKRQYDLGFRITREKLAYLLPEATANQLNQIIATKEKYFSKFLKKTIVNQDLLQVLKEYKGKNNLILITRSHRERALEVLSYHGIHNYFNSIISQFQDTKLKWQSKIPELMKNHEYSLQDLYLFENEEVERFDALNYGLNPNQIILVNV